METRTINVYTFAELKARADAEKANNEARKNGNMELNYQNRAIKAYEKAYEFVCDDYTGINFEDEFECLMEEQFTKKKLDFGRVEPRYSLSHSQGDGVAFYTQSGEHLEMVEALRQECPDQMAKEFPGLDTCSVTIRENNHHHHHYNTMSVDIDDDNRFTDAQYQMLKDMIKGILKELSLNCEGLGYELLSPKEEYLLRHATGYEGEVDDIFWFKADGEFVGIGPDAGNCE